MQLAVDDETLCMVFGLLGRYRDDLRLNLGERVEIAKIMMRAGDCSAPTLELVLGGDDQ